MKPSVFVRKVVDLYSLEKGIFSNKVNAEDHLPEDLSSNLDKSLYLFYVIQLDYATKSQRLYEGAKKLYFKKPDFFNPDYILALNDKELLDVVKDYLKPRYINEAVNRYKINSKDLKKLYGGNPLEMFYDSLTSKQALEKVKRFRGFGPKIGNFYVRTIINVFNLKYPDIENILPPVDTHDVKIAYLLGYTDSKKMTKKNINNVKNIWSDACKKANVSWLVFDKALWLLGSEGKPESKEDIISLLN